MKRKKLPDKLGKALGDKTSKPETQKPGYLDPQKTSDTEIQKTVNTEKRKARKPVKRKSSSTAKQKVGNTEKRKVKATFLLPQDTTESIDEAVLKLRKIAGRRGEITKSLIVQLALNIAVSDLIDRGEESQLARDAEIFLSVNTENQ